MIRVNEKKFQLLENVDIAELCIVSEVILEKSLEKETTCLTKKAEGTKCPVCWKMSKTSCKRHFA